MKRVLFLLVIFLFNGSFFSQDLDDLDSYTVDQFYKKIDLDYGALDSNGSRIDYIYVPTKIDSGTYKIELTDGDRDLYEVQGANLYMKFSGYFGYAGYGTECILKVGSYGGATVYKLKE